MVEVKAHRRSLQDIANSEISPQEKYGFFVREVQRELKEKEPDGKAINYFRRQLAIIRAQVRSKAQHEALNRIRNKIRKDEL